MSAALISMPSRASDGASWRPRRFRQASDPTGIAPCRSCQSAPRRVNRPWCAAALARNGSDGRTRFAGSRRRLAPGRARCLGGATSSHKAMVQRRGTGQSSRRRPTPPPDRTRRGPTSCHQTSAVGLTSFITSCGRAARRRPHQRRVQRDRGGGDTGGAPGVPDRGVDHLLVDADRPEGRRRSPARARDI